MLRAAIAFKEAGYGTPVLVGREEVYDLLREIGVENPKEYEVLNSRNSPLVGRAVDYIYAKHQRHGMLRREVERMVNQDRNYFRRRDARARRGRRDDHRHDPAVQPVASAVAAGHRRRVGCNSLRSERGGRAQSHGAHRRHGGDRTADAGAICGHRDAILGLRPANGPRAAGRVRQLHDLRQSARSRISRVSARP